ncbi:MAG: putative beta,3-glucanase [Bacteroidetes bacterium]|nr:putative beta,3-glucanase [Bacteroidota bacterium]
MKMKSTNPRMVKASFKNCTILISALIFQMNPVISQNQTYDDFEGNKVIHYSAKNGVLDSVMKNPAPSDINKSEKCAMYVRNKTQKFDNIKMPFNGMMSDVSPYATYLGVPPKLKMKLYTTAPVGTLVEILLGDKTKNNTYPAGTNSQFQAYTTVTGQWEDYYFDEISGPTVIAAQTGGILPNQKKDKQVQKKTK